MYPSTLAKLRLATNEEEVMKVEKSFLEDGFSTKQTTSIALYLDAIYPAITKRFFKHIGEIGEYQYFGRWFTGDAPKSLPPHAKAFLRGAYDNDEDHDGYDVVAMLQIQTILASGHTHLLDKLDIRHNVEQFVGPALALADYADKQLLKMGYAPRYAAALEEWVTKHSLPIQRANVLNYSDFFEQ